MDFNGYNLTTTKSFEVENGTSSTFANLEGRKITVGGKCVLNGSAGDSLNFNPASACTLNVSDTLKANYAVIGNCKATNKWGNASNSRHAGNNEKWNFFTEIPAPLSGVQQGSVAWGDYDNDGDLDILVMGDYAPTKITKIYRNDGGNAFTAISTSLPNANYGSVAWGDYDNDGDLDILLTGEDVSRISKIYRNDGGNTFTDISASLEPVRLSYAAWGDYNLSLIHI